MSRLFVVPLVLALSLPAAAQTQPPPPSVHDRFEELIDRLLGKVEPGLDALAEMLGDLGGWHAPEILPNGDILIRRRARPPEPPPRAPDPEATEPPIIEPFEL